MPKNQGWSRSDERRYKEILESCVGEHRKARGRKAGATKLCKRMAAATVNRDRAMASLGLGNIFERSLLAGRRAPHEQRHDPFEPTDFDIDRFEREAERRERQAEDAEDVLRRRGRLHPNKRDKRGLGAQLLSVSLPSGSFGGLRGWESGERSIKSGALVNRRGDRVAILSDADDTQASPREDREVMLAIDGDESYYPSKSSAIAAAKRMGFDGRRLRGLRGTPEQHARAARLLMSEANSWGYNEGPIVEAEYAARAAEEAMWSGDADLERKADRFQKAAERGAKASSTWRQR